MFIFSDFNPVAFKIFGLEIYWYGISYLLSIAIIWVTLRISIKAKMDTGVNRFGCKVICMSKGEIDDLIIFCAFGVLLGGRIGFEIFYDMQHFLKDPASLFRVWNGGMSFHGGLIGVTIGMLVFASRRKKSFIAIADLLAPLVPIGLFFGRIANFINGELIGRISNVSWAVSYTKLDGLGRHPSQLYEAFCEGALLLFLMQYLWKLRLIRNTFGFVGAKSAGFMVLYGLIRFVCEFFREPDIQLGFIAFGWMTMGQLLSIVMIIVGVAMMKICKCRALKF